jgi:hypothetical protein
MKIGSPLKFVTWINFMVLLLIGYKIKVLIHSVGKNPRVNLFRKFIFLLGFFPTQGFSTFVLVPYSRRIPSAEKGPRVRAFGVNDLL